MTDARANARGFAASATTTRGDDDASTSCDGGASDGGERGRDGDARDARARRDEEARAVLRERALRAALKRVRELGWTDAAVDAGLRDLNLSPAMRAIVRGDAGAGARDSGPGDGLAGELAGYFEECADAAFHAKVVAEGETLRAMKSRERVKWLMRARLEMIESKLDSWPRALAAMATPRYAMTTLRRRAALADFIADAADVDALDVLPDSLDTFRWHAERAAMLALYAATELRLLTDSSKDRRKTWAFLDARVDDIARSRVDVLELKSYIDVFARDADLTTLGASFASKDALAAAFAPVADVFARASRAVFSTPSRDASERDPPRDSPDR